MSAVLAAAFFCCQQLFVFSFLTNGLETKNIPWYVEERAYYSSMLYRYRVNRIHSYVACA